jgi:predicted aldo/keto reductase-like oxidoreductase
MAILGLKPLSGTADPVKKGAVTPEEALRYAMSVPGVTVTITGMDKIEVLQQNLLIAQSIEPMKHEEMKTLENRVRSVAADGL